MKPKCDQTSIFYFFLKILLWSVWELFSIPFLKEVPQVSTSAVLWEETLKEIYLIRQHLIIFYISMICWESEREKKMTLNKKVYKWLQNNCLPEEWSSIWAAYCQGILDSPWFLLITFPFFLGICQALQKVYKI